MKKLAVIGYPIQHSLSPVMHNAAIKSLGLDLVYSAVNITEKELPDFIMKARMDYLGFNVSVPHKTNIIKYLDNVSPDAEYGESVNTVLIDPDQKLNGFSTDGYGLERALYYEFSIDITKEKFFFIGCGGAAKAVIVYLLSLGARHILIANRTEKKAAEFVKKLGRKYLNGHLESCDIKDHKTIKDYFETDPVVIQATSQGLRKTDSIPLDMNLLHEKMKIFDMIYTMTPFLKEAKKRNCYCADGRLMLLYQGVKSLSIWTGIEPPVDVMRNALQSKLISTF